MNQEKIGKLIAKIRKEKHLTQKQLAEKLGITDRAISKWENGKSMPDLSLLKPLCNILNININDLLNGECISKKENLEENIVNAIEYSKKRQNIIEILFYLFILIFGTLILIITMSTFSSPSTFTMFSSIIGTYILMIIFSGLLKKFISSNKSEKYICVLVLGFFILYFGWFFTIDFINVKKNNAYPDVFVVSTASSTNSYSYNTFFYDLYICNPGTDKEHRKIVWNLKYNFDFEDVDKYCNFK